MFEKEQQEKKRTNQHILPVPPESFKDKAGKQAEVVYLPYVKIDIIFNHKNVWANLQNPNPSRIYYHLHNPS